MFAEVCSELDRDRLIAKLVRELKLIRDNCDHVWHNTPEGREQCDRCFLARKREYDRE